MEIAPPNINSPLAGARQVVNQIERNLSDFQAMQDTQGARVHCLFADLYLKTTIRWLAALEEEETPELAYLVIHWFYDIYRTSVPNYVNNGGDEPPPAWKNYHRLGKKLTMQSPIFAHLLLISFGARAHTRYDLAIAFRHALDDLAEIKGVREKVDCVPVLMLGDLSSQAFFQSALDFIEIHRSQRRGWRYVVLCGYKITLKALKPLWIIVLEGWRRRALEDAVADLH